MHTGGAAYYHHERELGQSMNKDLPVTSTTPLACLSVDYSLGRA